ncbi:MAG: glycosyltransferase family 39 protein [Proteobacteria bacterium]|nr:glycosyltransferase family 39 protein [Pseudomonadota bacterium]
MPLFFALAIAGLTALRLLVAGFTPISPDEAYYWVWSQAPAAGYLDHPFMVALWIRIGTTLFGDGALGIRLLAPLAAALGSVLILDAARRLGAGRGYAAALLLNATLLFGAGGILMTPDTPLILFWILALWAMTRIVTGGSGWWWIAAGIAAGLALDSKYTAALLLAGIGLWLLLLPAGRRWLLRDLRPWLGLVIAVALFLPVIVWNADHHWASFAKQGGRSEDFHPARAAQFLGELVFGQLGLATPVIFVLCVLGLIHAARRTIAQRDAAAGLLVALGVFPVLIFIEHALGDRVQGNWPEIIYPAAVIAAAMLPVTARWLNVALAVGFVMTLVIYVQAVASPLPLGGPTDPTVRVLGGWPGLAEAIQTEAHQTDAGFVAVDEYGVGSELALRLPRALPVIADDPRWLLFNLPHAQGLPAPGAHGLFLRTTRRHTPPDAAPWASMTLLGVVHRQRSGKTGESYRVYAVTVGPAASGLLTHLPSGAQK